MHLLPPNSPLFVPVRSCLTEIPRVFLNEIQKGKSGNNPGQKVSFSPVGANIWHISTKVHVHSSQQTSYLIAWPQKLLQKSTIWNAYLENDLCVLGNEINRAETDEMTNLERRLQAQTAAILDFQ